MATIVDVQLALSSAQQVPSEHQLGLWAEAAIQSHTQAQHPQANSDTELSLRIVDPEESQNLNKQYRGKDKPTNVLSFPADLPDFIESPLLGDLVICANVVATEAAEQQKELEHHWAHMVVHGCLHLLGYDHIDDTDAEEMEALEIEILARLNIANPYIVENSEVEQISA